MVLFFHLMIDLLSALFAAAGFVAFHVAVRQPTRAIKIAGVILIVAGVAGWLGNSYYGLRYLRDGYFDTPTMMPQGGMMKHRHRPSDSEG